MNDFTFWKDKVLYCMVGLPRSGKSTIAAILRHERGWPVISPDAMRLAVHGRVYIRESEEAVWTFVKYAVKALFLSGHNEVIFDACNLSREQRRAWVKLFPRRNFIIVNTDADTCLERAERGSRVDLVPVIERMVKQQDKIFNDEGEILYPEDIIDNLQEKILETINNPNIKIY